MGPHPHGSSVSAEPPAPAGAPCVLWAGQGHRPAPAPAVGPEPPALGWELPGRPGPPCRQGSYGMGLLPCTIGIFVSPAVRLLLSWQRFYLNIQHRQKMREGSGICVRPSERYPCSDAGISKGKTPKPRSGADTREYRSSHVCRWVEIPSSALPQPGALPGKHRLFSAAIQPLATGT